MIADLPLVSVNILSYNRKESLRNVLKKVYTQKYKNIEVIVVDNASVDGSAKMVGNEFPEVKLVELAKNIGISGWNKGFEIAKGAYVLVLDDDSYPTNEAIQNGIDVFGENAKLGIVAYKIFNNRIKKYETCDFNFQPKFFVGCGALISSKLLRKIGGYNEDYFIYYHEIDYSARCYNANFNIIYLDNAVVMHNQSLLGRGNISEEPYISRYRYYHYFISYNIFIIQNFKYKFAFLYMAKWWINRFIIAVYYMYFKEFFRAVFWLTKNLCVLLSNRNKLNKDVQKFYDNGNMPFIDREYFPHFKKR